MIRLIGILIGSSLAVAAIFVTLGLPELTLTNDASLNVPLPVAPDVQEPVVAVPELVPEPELTPEPDASIATLRDEMLPAATIAEEVTETVAEVAADPVVAAPAIIPSQNWYAFWSPFRSEIAADGFISELQRTTGLDYRVVKLKPGVYEVAFAYSDPIDRDTKLDRITAATGLDMSGG